MFGSIANADLNNFYKWGNVPLWIELIALIISNMGMLIVEKTQLENAYASKILDINKDQILIDSGLYANKTSTLSWWYLSNVFYAYYTWILMAVFPVFIAILATINRIKFEEEMLIAGMKGYSEYKKECHIS